MKRNLILSVLMTFMLISSAWAQRTITGTVSSADGPLPGATVQVKGTTIGTTTDIEGKYTIVVPDGSDVLQFRFVGFASKEEVIGSRTVIDVVMSDDETLDEVVVTALGLSREKQSLGYATQEISGEDVSVARETNVSDALSGKIAGLDIKRSPVAGGSTNVVIRGYSSMTGNNQALFVVDGVPINNSTYNTSDQMGGGTGYDYGNAASDINPDDIESINVLKGAAATALYGSRAANGAIIITTKKGNKKKKGIGVSLATSFNIGKIDKTTFAKYQKEYGQGYGPYYSGGDYPGLSLVDIDGDGVRDLVAPTGEDASFGERFDPNLMVYDWRSFYPELSTYKQALPWVAGAHDPSYFFQTTYMNSQNVAVSSSGDMGSVRIGYTRSEQTGMLPNSRFNKNIFDFAGEAKLTKKLTSSIKATYTTTDNLGRFNTGYNANIMSNFRQWWATNVDLKDLEEAFYNTGLNITWNPSSFFNTAPKYWDNPYFQREKSYTTDGRNRLFGYISTTYEVLDWLNVMGRITADTYSELREERYAKGGIELPSYTRRNFNVSEYNYDLFINFNKAISDKIGVAGLIGTNYRQNKFNSISASTNGGLVLPDLYALSNSVSPIQFPSETEYDIRVFGVFGQVSLDYDNLVYLEGTLRRDVFSTLAKGNNSFFYPSISTSFIFSNLLDLDVLSYGKFRASYAEVGNGAGPYNIRNTFNAIQGINGLPQYSNPAVSKNLNLVEERTKEVELGLETSFLNRRVGFDLSVYRKITSNQIFEVEVSSATGFQNQFINSGEIENKGIELQLFGSPVRTEDFEWKVIANYSTYKSKVLSLYGDSKNLLLNSFFGVTLNAAVGEPYGVLRGTDYVYDDAGNRVVREDGLYHKTRSRQEVLGDINPDFKMGITNSLSYKNFNLSFLIDVQEGGSVFTGDLYFGMSTGLYPETAGNNDLGNPKRNPLSEGGGVILDGVQGTVTYNEDGSYTVTDTRKNDVRADASTYENPLGRYGNAPDKQFVYDASYVKLRELTISYRLPKSLFEKYRIQGAQFSLVGRNLWIISKDLPYADPEQNFGAGNIQGYQVGAYPTLREFGFNLKLDF